MMTKRYFGFKNEESIGQLKIKVFLLFIIALGLFLFACISPQQELKPVNASITKNQTTANVTAKPCYALSKAEDQEECYYNEAEKSKNVSLCLNILNSSRRDKCVLPYSEKNVELCPKLGTDLLRDSCYAVNAQRLKKSEYCDQIKSNKTRSDCIDLVKPKVVVPTVEELCSSASDVNDCYLGYAILGKNLTTCSKINSDAIQTACIGIINNNPTVCDKFVYDEIRSLCYSTQAVETNNVVLCASANRSDYRNSCYQKLALANKNADYCATVDPETVRDSCYSEVAYKTLDATICSRVKAEGAKAACYIFTAKIASDPRICNNIEGSGYRNTCYSGVITLGPNITYVGCDGISSNTWHDNCYYELARRTKQVGYCLPIYDDLLKDRCKTIAK